jgi:hypothetical protein
MVTCATANAPGPEFQQFWSILTLLYGDSGYFSQYRSVVMGRVTEESEFDSSQRQKFILTISSKKVLKQTHILTMSTLWGECKLSGACS